MTPQELVSMWLEAARTIDGHIAEAADDPVRVGLLKVGAETTRACARQLDASLAGKDAKGVAAAAYGERPLPEHLR